MPNNTTLPGFRILISFGMAVAWSGSSHGDNEAQHNGIDKIYHPYVQPLETEIELRSLYQTDGDPAEDAIYRQRIGIGRAIWDSVFVEVNLLGISPPKGSFRLEAYELEARIQLSEQGEYWADWGLVFEVEKERSENITELGAKLVLEKELGSWVGTLNLGTEYEFGSNIDDEIEFDVAAQMRYRLSEHLEPAIELYKDEFTYAVGPVFQGLERFGARKLVHWELGVLFPLNNSTPDSTFRLLLEYEF